MMNHTAHETADVLLAADALDAESLRVMLAVFAGMANKTDAYDPMEREMFHSVARLLAKVRDIQTQRDKRMRKAERAARMCRNSSGDPDLARQFDAITAGI